MVNRGNDRRTIFRKDNDFQKFLGLLAEGQRRVPVRLFGYCGMPTHFHLLLKPETEMALSAYMQWVTCRYACDLRRETNTVRYGHVFQRRFWSVPVEGRLSFLNVLRYIEANPFRAGLVPRAEQWPWSSLVERAGIERNVLSPLPRELPDDWLNLVNTPQREGVLKLIRNALLVKRGRPPR